MGNGGKGPTALSFYLDDLAPYVIEHRPEGRELRAIPASALREFAQFIRRSGIAGASSVILGLHTRLFQPKTKLEEEYAEFVGKLPDHNLDIQMEIMTHDCLFDFEKMETITNTSEGAWLDEPSVSLDEYRRYFANTIRLASGLGVRYTGFTTPGTHANMNPHVWQALAELADAGAFPSPAVPVFAEIREDFPRMEPVLMARCGRGASYAVNSAHPDFLAGWGNSPERLDVNRYLSPEGSGRLADLIRNRSGMAIFHMHWPGMNPAIGLGWPAFQELVKRLNERFGDRIAWKRPSEIALERYCQEGDH